MPTEMTMMLLLTLLVGVVVFGGVTLTYFLAARGTGQGSSSTGRSDEITSAATHDDERQTHRPAA